MTRSLLCAAAAGLLTCAIGGLPVLANPAPFGACCLPDGTCEYIDEWTCEEILGGIWYEDRLCDPDPCPDPPIGACCFPDGTCVVTPPEACPAVAVWMGEGLFCEPNPCTPCKLPCGEGACCFQDGHCEYIQVGECESRDGSFQGEALFCEPDICAVAGAPEDPDPERQSWGRIKSRYRDDAR